MESWNFWWGIAAFFLGGLSSQLSGWLGYRRQRRDRAEDAQAARRQRREEFELQHLVEVHRLLRSLVASVVQLGSAHRMQRYESDDENAERFRVASDALQTSEQALALQVGFILDDQTRSLVEQALRAVDAASTDLISQEPEETEAPAVRAFGAAVRPAFEALAGRVRALYAARSGS